MRDEVSRRNLLISLPTIGFVAGGGVLQQRFSMRATQEGTKSLLHDSFPSQHPDLVRETVGVSHGNFERVKELVEAHPALAKASWDWGFGDHETALGAASHVGNREIALYLIEKGAAPTIFSATMLGQLDVVRAMVESFKSLKGIQVQRLPGPHGIPLLMHAELGGDEAKPVYDYLVALGGAGDRIAALDLSDLDRAKLAGTYSFGDAEQDRFVVSDERGGLWLKRGESGTARGLTHRGDFEFSPAGAPAVRIRFEFDGSEVAFLRIIDGDFELQAARAGA
jgi:hypothetical protein